MPFHDHKGSRRRAVRPLTAEQAAAIRALGLQWRDEWRADIAGRAGTANGHAVDTPAPRPPRPAKRAGHSAAQFAAAIARDAFGRFYWNEKQQEALAHSLKNGRRKRPPK
jgi:hypothetical protein